MDPHKQRQPGAIARTAKEWATTVRNESTIPSGVRTQGNFHHLVVSDCPFDNSASGISHAEYLHLRTIWYHYEEEHGDSFAGLFKDNPKTGYKGFVSPRAGKLAHEAMEKMFDPLKYYLGEFNKTNAHQWYFHPSANCGHYAMVRYWQVMTTTHVKGIGASTKVFKPQAGSNITAAHYFCSEY